MEREFTDAISDWLNAEMKERYGRDLCRRVLGARRYYKHHYIETLYALLPSDLVDRIIMLVESTDDLGGSGNLWEAWRLLQDDDVVIIMKAGAEKYVEEAAHDQNAAV